MRLMITGAAPISPVVLTFLRAALGCQVTHTHTHTIAECNLLLSCGVLLP